MAVNGGGSAGGTAFAARVPGLDVCGKTGTAQNPHGKDNSVFVCFAPKDDPKIAVAAYIENAGSGASWATPIASLLVEKYLRGEISPERKDLENRVLRTKLIRQ
jgi:penicillin-binding protein 2